MKQLLFVIPEYSHGGTNKSLENLLALMDHSRYEVSIYCLYEDGGDYYKRLFAPYVVRKSRLYYWLHDNVVTRKVMGFLMKCSPKINFQWLYRSEARWLERKHHYDCVIAYQEGAATQFVSYMSDKVKRIAWIQFDYAMYKDDASLFARKKWYDTYHHIVCVSKAALSSMLEMHPEYSNKSTYVYNALDVNAITASGEEPIVVPYQNDRFNIISIGRLNSVKQFEMIPGIVAQIREMTDSPFCWYIIGEGEEETRIREEIAKYHVEREVVLLGAKDNPYPYIRQANLLACVSKSESFSYVIAEAKVLHTPVLSTDFPVANEVVDERTGWIAPLDEIPNRLASIINDEGGGYSQKKASVSEYVYDNQDILRKIDTMLSSEC